MYQDIKVNSLFDNWNKFAVKIIPLMVNGIKDGNSKVLLQRLIEIQVTDTGNFNIVITYFLMFSFF